MLVFVLCCQDHLVIMLMIFLPEVVARPFGESFERFGLWDFCYPSKIYVHPFSPVGKKKLPVFSGSIFRGSFWNQGSPQVEMLWSVPTENGNVSLAQPGLFQSKDQMFFRKIPKITFPGSLLRRHSSLRI